MTQRSLAAFMIHQQIQTLLQKLCQLVLAALNSLALLPWSCSYSLWYGQMSVSRVTSSVCIIALFSKISKEKHKHKKEKYKPIMMKI